MSWGGNLLRGAIHTVEIAIVAYFLGLMLGMAGAFWPCGGTDRGGAVAQH
jgi:ABC-type arginine transport system permease subunit